MFLLSEGNSGWRSQTDSSEGFVCEKDAESGKVQVFPHPWAFDLLKEGFLPAFSLSLGDLDLSGIDQKWSINFI